jgi:hypothetical protein
VAETLAFLAEYKKRYWTEAELARLKALCEERDNTRLVWTRSFCERLLPQFSGRTVAGIQHAVQRLRGLKTQRKEPSLVLSPAEAAYLAAMIEGEGSVIRKPCRGFRLYLISNTDLALIDYIQKLVPFARIRVGTGQMRKMRWVLVTSRLEVLAVLRWVVPYMRGAKREKAEAILREILG